MKQNTTNLIDKLTWAVIAFAIAVFGYFALRYHIDQLVDQRLDDYYRTKMIETIIDAPIETPADSTNLIAYAIR